MYYIDSPTFSTATAVFIDDLLTVKAPDGYYKFGSGYREQLGGVLLNSIECTTCIDCKEFVSFEYKTGSGPGTTSRTLSYIDCWGYTHTLQFDDLPSTYGAQSVVSVGSLCVKDGSIISTGQGSVFQVICGDNPECDITTELIQSRVCGEIDPGSPTPTGCSATCAESPSLFQYIYIEKSTSGYLENGMIVYYTNDIGDFYVGGDLYYKVIYNNVVYGIRISDLGVISELTYCNP